MFFCVLQMCVIALSTATDIPLSLGSWAIQLLSNSQKWFNVQNESEVFPIAAVKVLISTILIQR